METLNILLPYALEIVSTLVIALIGVAGTWLTKKIAQQKNLVNIGIAFDQVVSAAEKTVGELKQTTVDALKNASPDGKLTEAQIADLKQQLLQKTVEKLSVPAIQLLEATKIDLNAIIIGAAEEFIGRLK